MSQTVLITGVNGFLARHLVQCLSKNPTLLLIGLDLSEKPSDHLTLYDYHSVDLTNCALVDLTVQRVKPNIVYHLAAMFRGDPLDLYNANFIGGINLLESVRSYAPDARVLIVGSSSEYGIVSADNMPITEETNCNPIDAYGLSKYSLTLAGLNYARNSSLKVCVARPFNLVGAGIPPTLVVGAILKRVKDAIINRTFTLKIGNTEAERDFIAVEDAVEGLVQLVNAEQCGEVFNICSNQPHSIRSVIDILLSNSDRAFRLVVDQDLVRPREVNSIYGSYEKAKRLIGFGPNISLGDSLESAWNFEMGDGN